MTEEQTPKRKRRTKEEIEAAIKEVEDIVDGHAPTYTYPIDLAPSTPPALTGTSLTFPSSKEDEVRIPDEVILDYVNSIAVDYDTGVVTFNLAGAMAVKIGVLQDLIIQQGIAEEVLTNGLVSMLSIWGRYGDVYLLLGLRTVETEE